MVLKHAVASLMEATAKLFGGRVPSVCLGAQEYFRDVFDHLARINAAIDGQREMLQTGISVTLTLVSIADSQVTKRLAAYGALITVPTLLAGIYGMNFDHMPELKWVGGYPLTLASMVLIDVGCSSSSARTAGCSDRVHEIDSSFHDVSHLHQ